MKKHLLILITLFLSINCYSQTFVINDISYIVTSTSQNTVGVSDYNINGGFNVTIPASIAVNSSSKSNSKKESSNTTYSVTTIEANAFSNKPITSVVIPSTITIIKAGAFFNSDLKSVTIPTSVTEIEVNAFAENNALNCVFSPNTTPPTLEVFSNAHSFGLDRGHMTLIIPAASFSAYSNPNNGAQWTGFRDGSEPFEVGDIFVSDYISYKITSTTNNTVEVNGYNLSGGNSVNIPETVSDCTSTYTVTKIAQNAFLSNGSTLTNVIIPNTITEIGKNAFNGCDLTNVTIPDSVITIGETAFVNNNITSVTLSEGLTTIGNNAFSSNNIITLTIPASVTNIGDGAFAVNNLTDVYSYATTPATITTVASNTDSFGSVRNTINLHIPTGTTDVYVTNAGALWTNFNSVTEDASLSTSTFEFENNIKVINTKNELKIVASNLALENYKIYNINGSKIKSGKESSISIDDLSTGIYILNITFDEGQFTKKFIK